MKKRIFAVIFIVVALFTCLLPFSAYAADDVIELAAHSRYYIESDLGVETYSSGVSNFGRILETEYGDPTFTTPFYFRVNDYNRIDLDVVPGSKLSFSFVFAIFSRLVNDSTSYKYYFNPTSENVSVELDSNNLVYGKDFFIENPVDYENYPKWIGANESSDTSLGKINFFRVYGVVDLDDLEINNIDLSISFLYDGPSSVSSVAPIAFSSNYPELTVVPPSFEDPSSGGAFMVHLSTFSSGILGVWQSILNFVIATGHEIVLISVFAWLFVLGVGSIRRQITGV